MKCWQVAGLRINRMEKGGTEDLAEGTQIIITFKISIRGGKRKTTALQWRQVVNLYSPSSKLTDHR